MPIPSEMLETQSSWFTSVRAGNHPEFDREVSLLGIMPHSFGGNPVPCLILARDAQGPKGITLNQANLQWLKSNCKFKVSNGEAELVKGQKAHLKTVPVVVEGESQRQWVLYDPAEDQVADPFDINDQIPF